jgi:hypothetical protein
MISHYFVAANSSPAQVLGQDGRFAMVGTKGRGVIGFSFRGMSLINSKAS